MNVDLEGFYTWQGYQTPNNIERIKKVIDIITSLIKQNMETCYKVR